MYSSRSTNLIVSWLLASLFHLYAWGYFIHSSCDSANSNKLISLSMYEAEGMATNVGRALGGSGADAPKLALFHLGPYSTAAEIYGAVSDFDGWDEEDSGSPETTLVLYCGGQWTTKMEDGKLLWQIPDTKIYITSPDTQKYRYVTDPLDLCQYQKLVNGVWEDNNPDAMKIGPERAHGGASIQPFIIICTPGYTGTNPQASIQDVINDFTVGTPLDTYDRFPILSGILLHEMVHVTSKAVCLPQPGVPEANGWEDCRDLTDGNGVKNPESLALYALAQRIKEYSDGAKYVSQQGLIVTQPKSKRSAIESPQRLHRESSVSRRHNLTRSCPWE